MNFRTGPWDSTIRPLVDTTPIVDTFLNLMIFFFLTASFESSEIEHRTKLDVELATGRAGATADRASDQFIAQIDRAGQITTDGAPTTLRELETRLSAWKQKNADGTLRIDADKEVAHGHVVEILAIAEKLKISRVSIGVKVPR